MVSEILKENRYSCYIPVTNVSICKEINERSDILEVVQFADIKNARNLI